MYIIRVGPHCTGGEESISSGNKYSPGIREKKGQKIMTQISTDLLNIYRILIFFQIQKIIMTWINTKVSVLEKYAFTAS